MHARKNAFMAQIPQNWPAMPLKDAHQRLTCAGAAFETMQAIVRGVEMQVWKNVPTTARDVFAQALSYADREFLVLGDERVRYDGFCRATLAIASLLQAHGLLKGERVGLAMRNLAEWPAIFLGSMLAGAIIVPLNAWWRGGELAYAIADCQARFVFADGERLNRMGDLPSCVKQLYVSRACKPVGRTHRLEDVIGLPKDWGDLVPREPRYVALSPEDDATIFYTSGTSGAPKGALGTHRSLTTNIFAMPFSNARNILRNGGNISNQPHALRQGAGKQRITLLTVPFFHVTGSLSILIPHMAAGAKLVLMRKFEPQLAGELIRKEKVTLTGGVPYIALSLLEHCVFEDMASLELINYGGAPSPLSLPCRIYEKFGVMAGQSWGMTETSATCTAHSGLDYLHRPASCGPALPVSKIKIMRDSRAQQPGSVGEVWAFGPNVVKGYWNNAQASAERFEDGWVKTGDLAQMDEEGFLTIVDRMHDVLIRAGENIYSIEVENVLLQHPAVADAAVIGLTDPLLGEVPQALIQVRPGGEVSEKAIQEFAAQHLAYFKVPVKVQFFSQPLPRNAGGKLIKSALRADFGR